MINVFIKLRKSILSNCKTKDFNCIRSRLIVDFLTRSIVEETNLYFSPPEVKKAVLVLMRDVVAIIRNLTISDQQAVELMTPMIGRFTGEVDQPGDLKQQLKWFINPICDNLEYNIDSEHAMRYPVRPLAARVCIANTLSIIQHMKNNDPDHYSSCVGLVDKYMFSIGIAGHAAKSVYDQKEEPVPQVIETCEFRSINDPGFDIERYLFYGPPALFYNHLPMIAEIVKCLRSCLCNIPFKFSLKKKDYGPFYYEYHSRYIHDKDELRYVLYTILRINNLPIFHNPTTCVNLLIKKFGVDRMLPIVFYCRNI